MYSVLCIMDIKCFPGSFEGKISCAGIMWNSKVKRCVDRRKYSENETYWKSTHDHNAIILYAVHSGFIHIFSCWDLLIS